MKLTDFIKLLQHIQRGSNEDATIEFWNGSDLTDDGHFIPSPHYTNMEMVNPRVVQNEYGNVCVRLVEKND